MGEEPHSGLEKANNAYISAKLLKVLGNDILGKQLTWKVFPNFHITVAGVFEDFPENTHLPKIDIAVALPTIGQIMGDGRDNWLGNDRYSGYVRLHPGTDPKTLEPNIKHMHVYQCLNGRTRTLGQPVLPEPETCKHDLPVFGIQSYHEYRFSGLCLYYAGSSSPELYPAGCFIGSQTS